MWYLNITCTCVTHVMFKYPSFWQLNVLPYTLLSPQAGRTSSNRSSTLRCCCSDLRWSPWNLPYHQRELWSDQGTDLSLSAYMSVKQEIVSLISLRYILSLILRHLNIHEHNLRSDFKQWSRNWVFTFLQWSDFYLAILCL